MHEEIREHVIEYDPGEGPGKDDEGTPIPRVSSKMGFEPGKAPRSKPSENWRKDLGLGGKDKKLSRRAEYRRRIEKKQLKKEEEDAALCPYDWSCLCPHCKGFLSPSFMKAASGRIGGRNTKSKLSVERRREIARNAGIASGAARRAKSTAKDECNEQESNE